MLQATRLVVLAAHEGRPGIRGQRVSGRRELSEG